METDKKISLIDKVKNANAESYEKWFDRWYKSLDIEKKFFDLRKKVTQVLQ